MYFPYGEEGGEGKREPIKNRIEALNYRQGKEWERKKGKIT